MRHRPDQDLGSFTQGEIPAALQYQFLDSDGDPITLAGFTAVFQWAAVGGTPTSGAATIMDVAQGQVRHPWSGAEFTAPGQYLAQFWVGNGGTTRYASCTIGWTVCQAVGTAPAI